MESGRAAMLSLFVLLCVAGSVPAAPAPQDDASGGMTFVAVGEETTFRPRKVSAAEAQAPPFAGLGRAAVLALRPTADGPLTVTVTSAHADVLVRQLDLQGAVVGEDDDGDVGWDSRLVVEGRRGRPVPLVAGFKEGVDGELVVRVDAGDVPPPSGLEAAVARVDRLEAHAEVCYARIPAYEALGKGPGDTAKAIAAGRFHLAGDLAYIVGMHDRCERLYARVQPLAEEIGHRLLEAVANGWRGGALVRLRRYDAAGPRLDRAIELAAGLRTSEVTEERRGGHDIEMFCRGLRAEVALDEGRLADALTDVDLALAIARDLDDAPNEAVLLARRAVVLEARGDRAGADASVASVEALVAGLADRDAAVTALLPVTDILQKRADFSGARDLLLPVLDAPVTPRNRAALVGTLANLAWTTSDILEAQELYEETLRISRRIGDTANESAALVALARCHEALGEHDAVRRCLLEVVPLVDAMDEGRSRAALLRELAGLRTAVGEYAEARRLVEEARALAARTGDTESLRHCLSSEVALDFEEGRDAEGRDRAAELVRLTEDRGHAERSVAANALAAFERRLGRLDAARDASERALEHGRASLDPTTHVHALYTACLLDAEVGDLERWAARLAEADTQFARLGIDRFAPDRAASLRSMLHGWSRLSQEHVAAALRTGPTDDAARERIVRDGFERAGFWKGRSLLHGIAEHRTGRRSQEVIAARRRLGDATARRAALLRRMASAQRDGARLEELAGLESAIAAADDDIERLVRELPPAQGDLLLPRGVSPDVVARVLDDRVLLEFTEGRDAVYAYVLDGGRLTFREVGAIEHVRAAVDAFLARISDPASLGTVDEVARHGRVLHDMLFADVPADGEVVVVPTSGLSALPFEALVVAAEDEPRTFADVTFVVDAHEVSYVPSAPVLVALAEEGARRALTGPALILGDPAYGDASRVGSPTDAARSTSRPEAWPRLPGTRGEALEIARLLAAVRSAAAEVAPEPDERDVVLETPAFSLRLGAEASAEAVRGDLRRYAIIHWASHGWADLQDPLASGVVLAPTADDDGYLSVARILDLDLEAELAVLSACRTGRGADVGGEGVQSVARAFLFAGARAVVASLWQADDRETGVVMKGFYSALIEQGASPERALREGRLAVRRSPGGDGAFVGAGRVGRGRPVARVPLPIEARVGHPYFWAPFVYVGAPRD